MRYLAWGIIIGATLAPIPQAEPCIDELWIIDDPVTAHYACRIGAVMELEPHLVKCVCEKKIITLVTQ